LVSLVKQFIKEDPIKRTTKVLLIGSLTIYFLKSQIFFSISIDISEAFITIKKLNEINNNRIRDLLKQVKKYFVSRVSSGKFTPGEKEGDYSILVSILRKKIMNEKRKRMKISMNMIPN